MAILEDIIVGSTAMFERLAQHEKYNRTVDLDILVSAAQEKVVKWLLRWDPARGKLFTWFSLHSDTPILLENGTTRKIVELVRERYSGKVMCWNPDKHIFEARAVTDWSEEPCTRKEWSKVFIRRPSGYSQPLYLTHEHRVWTRAGWVPASQLRPTDALYINKPILAPEGQGALLGLYLGDGSVHRNDLRVQHGKDQRFYNEWLARKFRGRLLENDTVCWNKFTKTMMDHTGETVSYFHANDMWPDYKKLSHPKHLTPWILDRLTPISLALWYMDDGSYCPSNGAVTFSTMSFTFPERLMLRRTLSTKFGLEVTLHKNKGLYLRAKHNNYFFSLVAPYILREFDYKISKAARLIPKVDLTLVKDSIECIKHVSVAERGKSSWEIRHRFKTYREESKGHYGAKTESFNWKYDLTVEGQHNFFAGPAHLLVSNSKCARHAFLSELGKMNLYRRRYHSTDDSLEKFIGTEDHSVDKHDLAADAKKRISEITCRWGHPQEIGCIRYLLECITDEDKRNKQGAIRAASYAWGMPPDMTKFFYRWAHAELRSAFYDRIKISMTETDLVYLEESYSLFVDLVNAIGLDLGKKAMALLGGNRVRIPTVTAAARLREEFEMHQEIEKTDLDSDSIAAIAAKHKRTARSATDSYEHMCNILNPRRAGEYYVFKENDPDQ